MLEDLASYNWWSNQKIADWLLLHDEEVYRSEVASSFRTIHGLLYHLMETEKYYLSLIQAKKVDYDESLTTEEVIREWLLQGKTLVDWLHIQGEGRLKRVITLNRSPVRERYAVATLITHLVNHSTYHRGQLLALRAQLDLAAAPKIDYYRYMHLQTHS